MFHVERFGMALVDKASGCSPHENVWPIGYGQAPLALDGQQVPHAGGATRDCGILDSLNHWRDVLVGV